MPNTTNPSTPVSNQLRGLLNHETGEGTARADDTVRDDEERSSRDGIAQMVRQLPPGDTPCPPAPPGVGGRQAPPPSPLIRGGYQDICNVFEFDVGVKKIAAGDPRLGELASMGLPDYWLQVADYLGVDAFLGMWRILDANRNSIPVSKSSGANSMAPTLRTYSNYLRFQKNRFVETLAAQGIEPKEIQSRVATQLCETISIVHIRRLTQKVRIKA